MPYIRSDGAVVQEEPVTVRRVLNWPLDLFWGIVNFFVLFFGSIFNVSVYACKVSTCVAALSFSSVLWPPGFATIADSAAVCVVAMIKPVISVLESA